MTRVMRCFLLFVCATSAGLAARSDLFGQQPSPIHLVEKCILDYQDYSSLGNPGSVFVDSATISSFRELFEPNAALCWDLYRKPSQKNPFLLQTEEYIDSVSVVYQGMKPVVSYGRFDIKMNSDGVTAIVYLVKIHSLPDLSSSSGPRFIRNIITLRILVNVYGDIALIQNIIPDTRLPVFRSLYAQWGYPFQTWFSGGFFGEPVSSLDQSVSGEFSVGRISGFSLGLSSDLRLNRRKADGIIVSIGLNYNQSRFNITVNQYIKASRQVFDPGSNAYECTLFDRAPTITEAISIQSLSIPVTLKFYLFENQRRTNPRSKAEARAGEGLRAANAIRLKYYVRGGVHLTLLDARTTASYTLSHTGGGWVIYEREKNLPLPDQRWFYLDEENERKDQPNFFTDRFFENTTALSTSTLTLSMLLAAGIEVKINKWLIGFEPWFSAGLTPLFTGPGRTTYSLYPIETFTSYLETYPSLKINSFGLNVVIGKLFYRKY